MVDIESVMLRIVTVSIVTVAQRRNKFRACDVCLSNRTCYDVILRFLHQRQGACHASEEPNVTSRATPFRSLATSPISTTLFMCLHPSPAVESPLLSILGVVVSDIASLRHNTSVEQVFGCLLITPQAFASVLQMLQDLVTARASVHFPLGTRSWRNAPVLVSPHCAMLVSEIRRGPSHEQHLRLPALMSDDGLFTYYTAGGDQ